MAAGLKVSSYSAAGKSAGEVELPSAIFGEEPNQAVMHQAYVRQVNNARQGTAKVKRRGEVSGGGAKPYRQKGTGRARHGSTREPSMVGGGSVFGPQPRSYAQDMPRKMRRLALRSALSVKADEGLVSVLEAFEIDAPRTGAMVELLRGMGVAEGRNALIVMASPDDLVYRSFNNLPWAKVILARNLNLYDIFTHEHLVVTRDCLDVLEETFSDPGRAAGRAERAEPAARTATRTATKSASKTATKSASKTASKTATKSATKSASKSESKSASKTASKTANKTATKSASKSASKTTGKPAARATARTTDESAEKKKS